MSSSPASLQELFAEMPDPRGKHGKRHPLPAILGLAAVAMLAGMQSLEAIAQYGRDQGAWLARELGFRRTKTPCAATFCLLFRQLDVELFEAKLAQWLGSVSPGEHVALDGKTLRGSRSKQLPGVHLLAAYAPKQAAVLAPMTVDGKTNEHKAALELLKITPLKGAVVTAVRDQEADYLITVKDNQANLKRDIELALGEVPEGYSPLREEEATCPA